MGFFYRAPGGGGNDPSYPSSPITFDDATSTQTFNLTNTGTTPASVELSFSSLSGGQTLLIGQNYDQGTDTSPTYVIDPDDPTRTVTLARGALSPSSPSSSEIVTLTSNAGVLPQTITCTVEPLVNIQSSIRAIATPTFEFLFENNFSNTGSKGGSSSAGSMTATASSLYTGAVGYGAATAGSSRHTQTVLKQDVVRNGDRSWINAFHIISDTAGVGRYVSITFGNASESGPGWLVSDTSGFKYQYNIGFNSFICDTSHNFTTGGSSKAIGRTAGTTVLCCASYDSSASTLTYRWKKNGDGDGHSYGQLTSVAAQTSTGNGTCYWSGFSSSAYYSIRFLNQSVINDVVSEVEFNSIASAMGL